MNVPWIIETKDLSYTFRHASIRTLKSIDVQVPPDSIYCFLGPNGAGKTTTLRLVLGLLGGYEGEIRIFGKSLLKNRVELLRQIGSLLEQPSLYGHLTGKQNLEIYRLTYRQDHQRVQEVLEITDMCDARNDLVRNYSLGMKQRLAIALALLNDPALLILDEPTNGLDPQGIVDMRALILKLRNVHLKTILVSSHLLSEVEKIATHFGVLNKGALQFQGTREELAGRRSRHAVLQLETDDVQKAIAILQDRFAATTVSESSVQVKDITKDQVPDIARHLVASGVGIYHIGLVNEDLEETFFQLTS